MYRVWGGESEQVGEWLSLTRPTSASLARQGLELRPGNTAQWYSEVVVPAGTRYQIGSAAANYGQRGGALQVQLLERIPEVNFGRGIPLPR